MKKKILSILLVLVLCVGMLPVTAFAADNCQINIVWDDDNNKYENQPDSVTVKLLDENQVVLQSQTITSGAWTSTVDIDPTGVSYVIVENALGYNYAPKLSGSTVTITMTNKTVQVPLTVVWNDNGNTDGRPETLSVNATIDGGFDVGTLKGNVSKTETSQNFGSFTVPAYYKKNKVTLSVAPPEVEGYTGTASTNGSAVTLTYTLNNTNTTTVSINWDDNNGKFGNRPSEIKVGWGPNDGSDTVVEPYWSLSASTNWSATITGPNKPDYVLKYDTFNASYTNLGLSGSFENGYTIGYKETLYPIDFKLVWAGDDGIEDVRQAVAPSGQKTILKVVMDGMEYEVDSAVTIPSTESDTQDIGTLYYPVLYNGKGITEFKFSKSELTPYYVCTTQQEMVDDKAVITLTYTYQPPESITVTYDAGEGKFSNGSATLTDTKQLNGANHAIFDTTNDYPTRDGFDFMGWKTSDGTTLDKDGTGTFLWDTTLHAIWQVATVKTPVISPNGGEFTDSQQVTITCATEGATIYYTTDGSTPDTSSTEYTQPFTLTGDTTVKAIAVKEGMLDSAAATANFHKLVPVDTPVISPNGGNFTDSQEVTISCTTEDATIYYTTDGRAPNTNSTKYTGPFTLTGDTTVKAIAVKEGMLDSAAATAEFHKLVPVDTPVISPNGGEFTGSQEVTITCATEGATIYYTTNGKDPKTDGTEYTQPFTLTDHTEVKAIAVKAGMNDSAIASATFLRATVAAPKISPKGGNFAGSLTVTITCATEGATIYYTTTDDSYPDTNGKVYTGPFTLTDSATVRVFAVKENMNDSIPVTAYFRKLDPVDTPVISPDGGNFTDSQEVTITCTTEGATIYYTTDGTDPTTASNVYEGSFTLTGDTTVKAIAVKNGVPNSAVASADFTEVTLEKIEITKAPNKTGYDMGQSFDATGMVVTATYSDSSTAVVTGYTVPDGDDMPAGKTTVTIRYTEADETREATQTISVVPEFNDENGLRYRVLTEDTAAGTGTVEVIRNGYNKTNYVIPSMHEKCGIKYTVTAIGDDAFRDHRVALTVTLPDTLTTIGNRAFYNSGGLTGMTFPASVTSIGEEAFYRCYFKQMHIPGTVKTIGKYAFHDCEVLDQLTLGEGITSIGEGAFYSSSGLKEVTIPSTVKTIEKNTFYECVKLTTVTMPEGLTSIGESAFNKCYALASADIPGTVTSIGNYAFAECHYITSVTIPAGVTSIGNGTFSSCYDIATLSLPEGLTTIGEEAFYYCMDLTAIDIPDSVTSIGKNAFYGCKSALSIQIPQGITTLEEDVFGYCESVAEVVIPDGVTTIGDGAFSRCAALTRVDIPNSVTTIVRWAFYNCTALTDVYFYGTKAEWDAISIDAQNVPLENATLHCYWDITLQYNDGETADTTVYTDVDGKLNPLPTPTKSGYIFDGWYDAAGTEVTTSTKFTEDTTVIAKWLADYSIINGENQSVTQGEAAVFTSDAAFEKFLEVQVDGKTVDSSNYTAESGSTKVTLKKEFVETLAPGEHTLTIVSNDGSANTKFTVNLPTYTLTTEVKGGHGKISDGENDVKSGTSKMVLFTPDDGYEIDRVTVNGEVKGVADNKLNVTITEDTAVVVTYKACRYTVSFDVNGGKALSTADKTKTVTYNEKYGTLPTPKHASKYFAGWYTAKTGGSRVYDTTTVTATADHTLYAHWSNVPLTGDDVSVAQIAALTGALTLSLAGLAAVLVYKKRKAE